MEIRKISHDEWLEEGIDLFGSDVKTWRFVCPVCGHVQTIQDFLDKTNLDKDTIGTVIGFSCIGRWIEGSRESLTGEGKGPCDYAGGGLMRLNPIHVERDGKTQQAFDFDRGSL